MSFTDGLTLIGGLTAAFYLLRLTWRCWCGFRAFILSEHWRVDLRTYGQWAVVTGSTSGIGKAYAVELARRGLNIVLVSRSDDKLRLVAGEIVNNVGMTSTDNFSYFLETPEPQQRITEIINCNLLSVPQMTRLVLPQMVERGTGLIINISSILGLRPQPLLSLYSATKNFVAHFSECLHAEYKSNGITVQCVAPSMVSTNMTNNIKTNCFVKSASAFAHEALNTVGHSNYTSGCLSHALQNVALTVLFPDWIRMSTFLIRKLRNIPRWEKHEEYLHRKKEKLTEKAE
ncbi:hydroxysteroid (20-beta) dehydrogenase 2 isoform 2-T2 [Pholidichthys leucotaenia]